MKSLAMLLALVLATLPLPACALTPLAAQDQAALQAAAQAALLELQASDPALAQQTRDALAYAVFPDVGKGAVGIGVAYGTGVYVEDGAIKGYCNVIQTSLGVQLGGQSYVEIVCFSTPQAMAHFKKGVYSVSAQASAVALASGGATLGDSLSGVAVFFRDPAGLMAEVSVGIQEFHFRAL